MGQAESNSKLDVNEFGLAEMDAKLLYYRKQLMTLVQNNGDTTSTIIYLIALPVPISMKYACLDVKQLFSLNNKTVEELRRIPLALGILEKYGRHVLKPVNARAEMWRCVKFSNPIYNERVKPLKGSSDIMKLIGYSMPLEDGVYFPEDHQPDPTRTLNLVCDLIISKTEMELYLSGKHPQSSDIEQFLPENTVASINELLGRRKSSIQPSVNLHINETREPDATEKTNEGKLGYKCELCLCSDAEIYCEACGNTMLCKTCDINWHQHPRRQHGEEKRKKLDSNFVTQTPPRIAHQGAYGVSEVIKRKTNQESGPVATPPNVAPLELSMKKEPDADPLITSPFQSPSSNLENIDDHLRRHHMKIKSYSEQSTKYQPVKFSASACKRDSVSNSDDISYPPVFNILPAVGPAISSSLAPNISEAMPVHTKSEPITMTSSLGKSQLLSKIMTLPNIDKRKCKCEINIVAIDEEITEMDKDLNKILSQDDQFLENEEFGRLNRKKMTLIREKKILEEYLKEIEASEIDNSATLSDKKESRAPMEQHSDSKGKDTKEIRAPVNQQFDSTVRDSKELRAPNEQVPQGESSAVTNDESLNWTCKHCTYSNVPQVHVCSVCSKTNEEHSVPLTKQKSDITEKPKPIDLENVGNKFNALQDTVYLEKKAAQSLYNNQHHEPISDVSLVEIAHPSAQSTPVTKNSAIKSSSENKIEEMEENIPPSYTHLPSEQFQDLMPKIDRKHPGTTQSFQEIMKVNSEAKVQNEIKSNGFQLFQIVKKADQLGYEIEEVEVALAQLSNGSLHVLEWLDENWQGYIDSVFEKIRLRTRNLINNTIGELSTKEVKDALKKCKGNIEEAVEVCVAKRQLLYSTLNTDESIPRETVLETMLECNGDEEKIQDKLIQISLQPFIDRIWEDVAIYDDRETCNSVSNSIIERDHFQDSVKDASIDKERRTRMVFMEGKLKSWGRAETVIKIVDEELGKESLQMSNLEDVIEAVRNCTGFKTSLAYLQQTCEICFTEFPMSKITSLNICQCKLCVECIKLHFQHCVKDMNVRKWSCPVCGGPNMADPDIAQNYLQFLKLLITSSCDQPTQDLFDKKANLWYIQQDANFRWCAHCETGFIFQGAPHQLCMTCINCSQKTCFKCKKEWEVQHNGLTCEEFEQWKYDNDPNNQAVGLANHLKENGIDCPSCKMRFSLSKGGCMHFTCLQCSHEFCSGCDEPFYHDNTCPLKCVGKGLHCHHPRDCFNYLRDEEPATLQQLLQMHNKSFDKDVNESSATCPVMEQKERNHMSNYDEACGKEVKAGCAGLCTDHYREYLVGLINKHTLDPLDLIKTEDPLKIILTRLNVKNMEKRPNEGKAEFIARLKKTIKKKEPLKNHN